LATAIHLRLPDFSVNLNFQPTGSSVKEWHRRLAPYAANCSKNGGRVLAMVSEFVVQDMRRETRGCSQVRREWHTMGAGGYVIHPFKCQRLLEALFRAMKMMDKAFGREGHLMQSSGSIEHMINSLAKKSDPEVVHPLS
jgi:hypothetical protein